MDTSCAQGRQGSWGSLPSSPGCSRRNRRSFGGLSGMFLAVVSFASDLVSLLCFVLIEQKYSSNRQAVAELQERISSLHALMSDMESRECLEGLKKPLETLQRYAPVVIFFRVLTRAAAGKYRKPAMKQRPSTRNPLRARLCARRALRKSLTDSFKGSLGISLTSR